MISAKEAKFESENRATIIAAEEEINASIMESIEKGECRASIKFPENLKYNVEERILFDLKELGYMAEFPVSPKKSGGSTLVVSWETPLNTEEK